ncbi:2-hydroxycarboxylate transporter family protein [Desmospora activa]|uniref:Malate:Na+ symporter n=1 Tax=Desmospora activa DSM 45169 TaxID=1121389 RepID=A0A2T4ZD34_9BACL|nr:2-hydroxycarboxylate transporter family protein [Desmospora activa]PTM59808.1 malate:Na+ symporter [Desmospora activa DSM 45169]
MKSAETIPPPFLSRLAAMKVGFLPLPLYLVLAAIIYLAAVYNKLPADMIGGFAVIMALGILLGDLGQRIPILKDIGGPAILALFVPSIMIFFDFFSPSAVEAITVLVDNKPGSANFLYLYISILVVGSILGMHRTVMIQGFIRMFVPLAAGTIASILMGLLVGTLFGYELYHTFFFIIVPIIGGGVGEGILPLSLAYSHILGAPAESFISQMIPAAVLGNIIAVISAGLLKRLGEKKPELSGNGMLVKSGNEKELLALQNEEKPIQFPLMGAGLILACSFFIFGKVAEGFVEIPGAILMIFLAAIVKYIQVLPAKMEQGAFHLYKFISSTLTWPLMVGLGVLFIPLDEVLKVISPSYIAIVMSVVITMVMTGFYVGKWMKMYSIEAAIVTGCHSGLGGTGDVAILSSSNRMQLMPFAQISTRIGGASTIIMATLLMQLFH